MPRFAAIDVGSNAIRLRVVEASAPSSAARAQALLPGADGAWKDLATLRAPVRLGAEVFLSGRLAPNSVGQACVALREFRQEMDRWKVDAYRAIATSAVREAKNGSTLVERARREAGIALETIEGIEEARLIQLAVTRRLPLADKRALLVDVGGGSTELTLVDRGETAFTMSLPLGTVRMLEAYLKGVKTVDRARERLLEEAIDRALGEALPQLGTVDVLTGTGGNVDTLCDLCPAKGVARGIDVAAAKVLFKKMCGMSNAERRDAYELRPDRADTIVPATAIFLRLATVLKASTIISPGVGLAAGVLEELVDKFFHVWDAAGEAERVIEACARLGRRFHFDELHARHVCRFATQLFDDLQLVHAFGERDRLLLRVSAMLHDIGDYVHYSGHHKHSQYLIAHADIMGITPEERAIVANIARYHRKGPPDTSHPGYRDLDKEARGKVRGLAGILRIADSLDREHKQKIESVRAAMDRGAGRVTLFLHGADDRELEEWSVRNKANLWRDEYDLEVDIAKAEVEQ
ncbi:MAG TPA: Ppx/GppA phosphatase family protein [Polyangiaceae bacterium]|jgi:exopolyphosphatase/guanosine-5'-triphosphate,3'-diphosphate pyrophosphatase|nr:Ppx/GppA phosphatase family protein [Polyangiaceae bacterium]